MITAIPGVRVGHWTHPDAATGCTVVLPPPGSVASGEVRGGAPAEREFALLAPERLVDHVDAVVLTGGSAFGLAACDGAMRWCEEQGLGVQTPAGRVPIVVGMGLYDLVASGGARPGADAGYAACASASAEPPETGPVGAGRGATVGAGVGPDAARRGGVGAALAREGDLMVGALMAVNAFGDLREPGGAPPSPAGGAPFQNTTIGVIATNASAGKLGCLLIAQSGHDGMARALDPAHTAFDGDALVAFATGAVDAPPEAARVLAARAVEAAIRQAVAAPR
ncbi:MAG: hypothetical protein QOJ07_2087 [Thermoleophilaceae bacterium]|nr:hypothetical protein [Thermoleophilaceae bacterium]